MKINLKTTIRYNGREYSSLEELPEPVRAAYEKLLSSTNANAPDTSTAPEGGVVVKRTFVFNGNKFASPNEMPEADRKIYEDLVQLVKDGDRRDHQSTDHGRRDEIGWLTPNQKKLVVVVAGLILIAALVIALRSLS